MDQNELLGILLERIMERRLRVTDKIKDIWKCISQFDLHSSVVVKLEGGGKE